MKLQTLTIIRKPSYASGPELSAQAVFEGPGGKIEVELAPGFIVRVLALIEVDAAERAKRLASGVASAMTDAVDDCRLLEADKPLALEDGGPL